ncbi:probable endolytic peptidoglycan transglycosylase RlpA isoform X2 [Metopolophium dirhodum]|nr:probable endolytic peptidoglycan transglycosylase RlpA isoform X2 [Metopolophium dirhodum]
MCLSHNECCSGYCFMEPGWAFGVCKKLKSPKKSDQPNNGKNSVNNNEQNNEVHDKLDDVFETGVCAYYKGEHITANGEVFNEDEMTAAHRTLPFNTMVKVETMGTSVVVKINDRKTSSDGKVMLLSHAAAKSLNIYEDTGPAQCRLKIVTDLGCTTNYGNTCVQHHECCSQNCFREMFSTEGFCTPQ